jgi:hypothetical protein
VTSVIAYSTSVQFSLAVVVVVFIWRPIAR